MSYIGNQPAEKLLSSADIQDGSIGLVDLARSGTSGQVLTSGGTDSNPSYRDIPKALEADFNTGTDNTKFVTALIARNNSIIQTSAVTASGTSILFTGIPAWVKKVTVVLNEVSTNGSSVMQIQLGNAEGIQTSSYISTRTVLSGSSTTTSISSGHSVSSGGAGDYCSGTVTFCKLGGASYVGNGIVRHSNTAQSISSSLVFITNPLTQLRVTTVNGTDVFDTGFVGLLLE